MVCPAGILRPALHDGFVGIPVKSVTRGGHVEAAHFSIRPSVRHQVPAGVLTTHGDSAP